MKNQFSKKLSASLVILFITTVLFGVVYTPFAEGQTTPVPALNGYTPNAAQSKWIEYIAKEVVPLLPGSADEKADIAARATWWTLKESVLDVVSPENPIGYSNCDDTATGNHHVNFLYDCKATIWQVGIAGVQVNDHTEEAVEAAAAKIYPGKSHRDIIARVAVLSGYPEGSTEYNGAVNSTGNLRKSLLMRDPAIGFVLEAPLVTNQCINDRKSWCVGSGSAKSVATDVNVTKKVVGELTAYYKNFASGAISPTTPLSPTAEGQKEIPLGLPEQISRFYSFALGIGGLVALGVLIFGGILYTASAGSASRQEDAKQWITGSIIGLIILFGSFFILNTINPDLTKLTDLRLLANKAAEPSGQQSQTGFPSSGSEIITSGLGPGNSPFLVTNVPIQVTSPGCGLPYKFPQTSFNMSQASCPVYPLAESFRYDQGGFCGGNRAHPGDVHHASDISAARGSPVYAVEDGKIIAPFGFLAGSGGNRLWLQGNSSLKYYYAHMLSYAPGISEGLDVKAGQLLGFVNETGNAKGTGNHLHFSVYPKDGDEVTGYNAINPVILLNQVCNPESVPPAESSGLAQVLNKSPYNEFGVVFTELGGRSASVSGDKTFPIASLYKLFLAKWTYDQKLDFNQKIPLRNVGNCSRQGAKFRGSGNLLENCQDGVGFLYQNDTPREGQLVSISDCMQKMIIYSDNVCGSSILNWARDNKGYTGPGGLSEYSANSISDLLNSIKDIPGIYNLMRQQYHDKKIPEGVREVLPGAEIANKTGELHDNIKVSHDAAIIKYNDKTYILVVMTGSNPDNPLTNQTIQNLASELLNALKK